MEASQRRPPRGDLNDFAALSGLQFEWSCSAKRTEKTSMSSVRAKDVTEQPPPVFRAPKFETKTGGAKCCGLWRTCPPWGDPTTPSRYLRMGCSEAVGYSDTESRIPP